MNITVDYKSITYGTGDPTKAYDLKLKIEKTNPNQPDKLSLHYKFTDTTKGYSANPSKESNALLTGAHIVMEKEEAEKLARLILYMIEHTAITKLPVELLLKSKNENDGA